MRGRKGLEEAREMGIGGNRRGQKGQGGQARMGMMGERRGDKEDSRDGDKKKSEETGKDGAGRVMGTRGQKL